MNPSVSNTTRVVIRLAEPASVVPSREQTFRDLVAKHEGDEQAHRAKLRRGATLFIQTGIDLDLVQYVICI